METNDTKPPITAYLFSIGESTTELSKWALEHYGFKVVLLQDPSTTLSQKYEQFLELAQGQDWVIRCDADIVVNKAFEHQVKLITNFWEQKPEFHDIWWFQFSTFCVMKQQIIHGPPMLMRKELIDYGQKFKKDFFHGISRPETAFFRDASVNAHTTTRDLINNGVVGMHGYKQRPEDIERVLAQKRDRNQLNEWDLELTMMVNNL